MKSKSKDRKLVLESLNLYFQKADEVFPSNRGLANRYVTLARKLAMKHRFRIPRDLQLKFCKHCYKYLRKGVNSTSRLSNGLLVITCSDCKKFTKFRYK